MAHLQNKIVDTTKYHAMAEFRRRTEGYTAWKNVLGILSSVADEYKVTAVCRQGSLYPNVYTLGYKDENAETTITFTIQE